MIRAKEQKMIPRFRFHGWWLAALLLIFLGAVACQAVQQCYCDALVGIPPAYPMPPAVQPWPEGKVERWKAPPVVLEVYTGPGFTEPELAQTSLPEMVVYADGRVITTQHQRIGEYHYQRTIHETQLSQGQLCQLLWQLEANGFYRVDQKAYVPPTITDHGVTNITARTWLSNTISAYDLYDAVNHQFGGVAPLELANTYLFLNALRLPEGKPYIADQVTLIVNQRPDRDAARLWPWSDVRLKDLADKESRSKPYQFHGEQAARIQTAVNDHWQLFEEDGKVYSVYLRPRLPYEQGNFDHYSREPYAYALEPTFDLVCDSKEIAPADAQVLAVATPLPATPLLPAPPGRLVKTINLPAVVEPYDYRTVQSVSRRGDVWLLEVDHEPAPPHLRLVHFDDSGEQQAAFEKIDEQSLSCEQYALAALSDQSVILADACSRQVRRIDDKGQVLARWGERGTGPGQLNLIHAIVAAPDEQSIYILDEGNRRIAQYELTGELMAEWSGDELGASLPYALAFGPQGEWYLIDEETHTVVAHEPDGSARWRWGLPHWRSIPRSLAVNGRGQVYVGSDESTVYAFDVNGVFLGRVGFADGAIFSGSNARVYIADSDAVQVLEP
jgi:hypothetical protein